MCVLRYGGGEGVEVYMCMCVEVRVWRSVGVEVRV